MSDLKKYKNRFFDFYFLRSYWTTTIKNMDMRADDLNFENLKIVHDFLRNHQDELYCDFNYDTWFKMIKMRNIDELNLILNKCANMIKGDSSFTLELLVQNCKLQDAEMYIKETEQPKNEYVDNCISLYSKPDTVKTNFGCYFIYDKSNKLAYIGKSNSNLIKRSVQSGLERLAGQFSRIDLYETDTHADASIYEIYFITTLKPYLNKESKSYDRPTIKLPDLKITNQILFYKSIDISNKNFTKEEIVNMDIFQDKISYVRLNGYSYRPNVTDNTYQFNYDI